MHAFYFLFYPNYKYKNFVQQVIAENKTSAIHIMNVSYSDNWYMIFSQSEFESYINSYGYQDIKPLPPLYEKK